MMVSRRDRYRNSEWGLFCRKLMWANNGVLMTAALLVIIVVWSGNEQIAGLLQENSLRECVRIKENK